LCSSKLPIFSLIPSIQILVSGAHARDVYYEKSQCDSPTSHSHSVLSEPKGTPVPSSRRLGEPDPARGFEPFVAWARVPSGSKSRGAWARPDRAFCAPRGTSSISDQNNDASKPVSGPGWNQDDATWLELVGHCVLNGAALVAQAVEFPDGPQGNRPGLGFDHGTLSSEER
jgi:hypothetical protein